MAERTAAKSGRSTDYSIKEVKPLDYNSPNGVITTKVYHGVSIVAGATPSTIIGRIQSWQPDSYTREGVHIYELGETAWGRPVDYVPGKATGFTIAVTRAEVWGDEMEKAFGATKVYTDLIDQNRPFTIKEFWMKGNSASTYHQWHYHGCWFQNKNMEAITSDGDGVVRISATLAYVSHRLYGSHK